MEWCINRCYRSMNFESVCSVDKSCVTLRSHGLRHIRVSYPSVSPRVCSNSCPLSLWCHPTISSTVSSSYCPQSYPASGSFPMSQLFVSSGQSIRTSTSVLPMNNQDWFPLELTGLIALLSKWNRNLSSCSWSWRVNFMNMQTLTVASK